MRWARNSSTKIGNIRFIRRFLFLPITIKNETRWLEFAVIEQKHDDNKWRNTLFLN